jgi:hypothetical protein
MKSIEKTVICFRDAQVRLLLTISLQQGESQREITQVPPERYGGAWLFQNPNSVFARSSMDH